MAANDRQVGGDHYRSDYIHWDLVIHVGMGYLEGNATKYISRHRKKGGLQDLHKALHYVDKLVETHSHFPPYGHRHCILVQMDRPFYQAAVARFSVVNELTDVEHQLVEALVVWESAADLRQARRLLQGLVEQVEHDELLKGRSEEIPPAKPVPLTEENHHAERVGYVKPENCLVRQGYAVDFAQNTISDCRYPNCVCEREPPRAD